MRVAVIGTGLIGGSIALGVRAAAADATVVGYDLDPASAEAARDRGAVTSVAEGPAEAVAGVDLVVVAVPVDRTAAVCAAIKQGVGPRTVVTDVGSSKMEAVAHGEAVFGRHFVGGHPMAGSERHGIAAADAELFSDAWWILTPTSTTSSRTYSAVADLAGMLGARPIALDPAAHDALVARLSHLPQLAASALVDVAAGAGDRDALLGLAGAGFRDVTRIAASHPEVWIAILKSNRAAVLDALAAMGGRLDDVAGLIRHERWGDLESFLSAARTARLELFSKPDTTGEMVGLSLTVPDRPGVLAEVTTAAGAHGINIEDLRIVHSTEGGRGRLEVVVQGEDRAALLTEALQGLHFRVERVEID